MIIVFFCVIVYVCLVAAAVLETLWKIKGRRHDMSKAFANTKFVKQQVAKGMLVGPAFSLGH